MYTDTLPGGFLAGDAAQISQLAGLAVLEGVAECQRAYAQTEDMPALVTSRTVPAATTCCVAVVPTVITGTEWSLAQHRAGMRLRALRMM